MDKKENLKQLDEQQDLKAFERRLTEVIASIQPGAIRWRILLGLNMVLVSFSAWFWLSDPQTSMVPLLESLWAHMIFTLTALGLIILFGYGIHKLVISPQIVTARTRSVLQDFNMSCDDSGKLILLRSQQRANI